MGTPSSRIVADLLTGTAATWPRRVRSIEQEATAGAEPTNGFRGARPTRKQEWRETRVFLGMLKPSLSCLWLLLFSLESHRLNATPAAAELSGPDKSGAAAQTDPSAASPPAARENHWAFRPLSDPIPPEPADGSPPSRTPVDAFIGARLRDAALVPAPSAGRRTWIRRLSFDLLGLPPAPDEVEAFVHDPDPEAHARCVERYLASPRYGERWGRWWLDLARYADTNGQDENKVMANAWRYRDWVIRSLNTNLPLDRFITDQLAGDLLPTNGVPEETVLDRWTATGLLVLGPKMLAEQDKPKLEMDLVDEQIDVVTRAFLGLTVGCARCHDHKFDPIPTRDYYALAGIFKSTRAMENLEFVSKFNERPVSTRAEHEAIERHAQQLASVQAAVTNTVFRANEDLNRRWRGELAAALGRLNSRSPGVAPAVAAESGTQDSPVLQRLAVWLAMDPATNRVARALRGLAEDPAQTLAALRDLETATEEESGVGSGLRLGPGRLGAGFVATGHNFLELPHAPSLDPEQLTVETWVRTSAFPKDGESRRWLVNKNGNEWVQGHYALVLDRNRPGAYLNIGGGRENVFAVWSDGPRLETNRWHHLAFTYDGIRLRLYVDGTPAGETAVNRPRIAGSTPLALARRQDGYVSFVGSLDEVRVYDRVLEPSELASRVAHPDSVDVAGAVARWEFNRLTTGEQGRVTRAELRDAVFGPGGLLALPEDPRPWYAAEDRALLNRLEGERETLSASAPPPAAFALAVAENSPRDLPVFARGSHLAPGKDPVPRGFVQVVNRGTAEAPPADRSGRLELARWLTSAEQPLTARVMVNRVWQAHFGEGLVRTSDNFGLRGELPSHPELLDWLARELIRSGWDLKHLHRLILNSNTYRQASGAVGPDGLDPQSARRALVDPDNRLLSRFPRQRLEAEMVRDALLAVSGRLDVTPGGSLVRWKNNDYVPADEVSEKSVRRSVYLPVVRDRVYDVFTLFDFANPSVGTAKRTPTVVSHQALFFLNSPLVRDCARSLADNLIAGDAEESLRIQQAYERLFSRPPTDSETARALVFLRRIGSPAAPDAPLTAWSAFCQSLMASNEFLYRE